MLSMYFQNSLKKSKEQYGFTELHKWHKLKCVYVLAGAYQKHVLKSLLQITLAGVAVGFAAQGRLWSWSVRSFCAPNHGPV